MDQLKSENAQKRIDLIQKTLTGSTGWYTGLSIKKYLTKNIFSLKKDGFGNPAINSGRWSAYCHYSAVVAFKNLLDKHEINQDSKVLIHPLLPADLANLIIERGAKIDSVDINKEDLAMDAGKFEEYVNNNKQNVNLVIFFAFNGIYEPIIQAQESLKKFFIPSLTFIDNANMNNRLLELFDKASLGSVLWDFGKSFVDDVLGEVVEKSLPNRRWFVSWFVETRTKSLLEYHLSESKEVYQEVLSAYHYLMKEKYPKLGIKNKFAGWLNTKMNTDFLYKGKVEALSVIEENFPLVLNSAVPDVFFDLHEADEKSKEEKAREEILFQESSIKEKARDYFDFFATQVELRPDGTLEIPRLNPLKTYFEYFFYSTEQPYWRQRLGEKGYLLRGPIKILPQLKEREDLSNANFVAMFLISIKLVEAISKNLNLNDY